MNDSDVRTRGPVRYPARSRFATGAKQIAQAVKFEDRVEVSVRWCT